MKNFLMYIIFGFGLTSCIKEEFTPNGQPLPPQPIVTNPIDIDSATNIVGQTWVITGYRIGEFGNITPLNDVLYFSNYTTYKYNNDKFSYSFYTTASAYNLTLNNTPFGNITGTIYEGNLESGFINGLKFVDITIGSSNTTNIYLWMERQ